METHQIIRTLKAPNDEGLLEYLIVKQSLMSAYHNHKENMANAGVLVQISLFGAVVTETIWPPDWVAQIFSEPETITFIAYSLLWALIHMHIRWQLANKRAAAHWVSGLDIACRRLLFERPDVKSRSTAKEEKKLPRWLRDLLVGLLPLPLYFQMDANTDGLPCFVAKEVDAALKSKSGGSLLEVLINVTSYALLAIIGSKIFLGPV